MAVVENLIARLGFEVTGLDKLKQADKALDSTKKNVRGFAGAIRGTVTGSMSGFTAVSAGFSQAAKSSTAAVGAVRNLQRQTIATAGAFSRLAATARQAGNSVRGAVAAVGRGSQAGVARGGTVVAGGAGRQVAAVAGAAGVIAGVRRAVTTGARNQSSARELALTGGISNIRGEEHLATMRGQATALGVTPEEQLAIANAYVGALGDEKKAMAALIPTIRAAKATFSDMNETAKVGVALSDNLKVSAEDMTPAFGALSVAADEGKVNFKEMARVMPKVAASGASGLGLRGVSGAADIGSMLQVAGKITGSADTAADWVSDYIRTLNSPATRKALQKELGVNLETLAKKLKPGETLSDAFLDVVQTKTGGNIFRTSEIMGQAGAGEMMNALLRERKFYRETRSKAVAGAGSEIDNRYSRTQDLAQEELNRLRAATETRFGEAGESGPARGFIRGLTELIEGANQKRGIPGAAAVVGGWLGKPLHGLLPGSRQPNVPQFTQMPAASRNIGMDAAKAGIGSMGASAAGIAPTLGGAASFNFDKVIGDAANVKAALGEVQGAATAAVGAIGGISQPITVNTDAAIAALEALRKKASETAASVGSIMSGIAGKVNGATDLAKNGNLGSFSTSTGAP